MKSQLFFFSCLLTVNTYSQTTLTLQPDAVSGKDAEVFSCVACGYADANYGSKKDLNAIAWTNSSNLSNIRSLLQFNLAAIPVNAVVTEAKLSLFYNPTSTEGQHFGSNAVLVQRIVNPWAENTVTWNNQPSTTTTGQVLLPASISNTQNYLDIPITAMVQQMVCSPATNFGFMLRQQTESIFRKMIFASSDNTTPSLRPKLVITYTIPLPVELLFFKPVTKLSSVELHWATASEKINEGFEVERSFDAQHFEKIAFISGNGTTNMRQEYAYEDKQMVQGETYFYRLKQVDFDGNYTYSKIISARIEISEIELKVCAHTASSITIISCTMPANSHATLRIFTAAGKELMLFNLNAIEAGPHPFIFDPGRYAVQEHVFIVQLVIGAKMISQKFIAQ